MLLDKAVIDPSDTRGYRDRAHFFVEKSKAILLMSPEWVMLIGLAPLDTQQTRAPPSACSDGHVSSGNGLEEAGVALSCTSLES